MMLPPQQLVGQVVDGDVRLLEYLGGSERSIVFLAEVDGDQPRKAIVKLFLEEPEAVELRLARLEQAAKLSHPNLLGIARTGIARLDDRDLPFAVIEYAEENLAQILPERALTPAEVSEMLDPTLAALAHLHGQGLAQAHLHPANIMAVGNQLKLAADSAVPFGTPTAGGKRDAPECATAGVSAASDAWSLGMTLVEVLTQKLPAWDADGDPVVPKELPEPFREIAQRCLRRDPQLRPTVAEIEQMLHPTAAAKAAPSKPAAEPKAVPAAVSAPRSAAVKRPSSKRSFIAPALVLVVVAAILIFTRSSHQAPAPVASESTEPSSAVPAPTSGAELAKPSAENPTPTVSSGEEAATETPVPEVRSNSPNSNVKTISDEPVLDDSRAEPAGEKQPMDVTERSTPDRSGVVRRVMPRASDRALRTISGKVRVKVKVKVNSAGDVVDSDFASRGPSRYFANLAMNAAREWKFAPASGNGSRSWTVEFDFRRSGVSAIPYLQNQ